MHRTTLFATTAAVALIGLGMIVVRTAGASGSTLIAAPAVPSPPVPMTSSASSVPGAAGVVPPGQAPAPAPAPTLPFAVSRAAPSGALGAQVMTGATVTLVPGVTVAPAPALVAPLPAPLPPGGFAPAPAPNPFGAAPGAAGFGVAPGPRSPPVGSGTDIATQAGAGPSQARASAVGPENEMATRAARASMAGAGAQGENQVATAPGNAAVGQGNAQQDPLAGWGPPPAPDVDPRRFTEAHWQGLEVVPRTPGLAQALKLPPGVQGVVVDDVTLPADLQGFQAGDLVTHVGQLPTPDLTSFIRATDVLRDGRSAQIDLLRDQQPVSTMLTALMDRLGTANGETPSMIPPGARMPHEFRGPCTNCHRIGTTGTLAVDQGDLMTTTAPTIRVGAQRPHRDRGPCLACHTVTP